jgi:hypothetical protein
MSKPQSFRPPSKRYPAKAGPIRAIQGIAPAFAELYHRLAAGTPEQQCAAVDFKNMVLSMGKDCPA